LKIGLREVGVGVVRGLILLAEDRVHVGSCEQGHEPLYSVKCGDFLNYLGDY